MLHPDNESVKKLQHWDRFIKELSYNDINVIFGYYTNSYNPELHNEPSIRQLLIEFFEMVIGWKLNDTEVLQKNINNLYLILEQRYGEFVNRKYLAPHVEQLINETDEQKLNDYYTNPNKPYTQYKFVMMEKIIHYCYDILNGKYDCLIKDKTQLFPTPKNNLKNLYGAYDVEQAQQQQQNGNSYVPNPLIQPENNQRVNGIPCLAKCGNIFRSNTLETIMPPVYITDRKIQKDFKFMVGVNLDQLQRMTQKQKHDFTEAVIIDYIRCLIEQFPLFSNNFKLTFRIDSL